MEGLLHTIPEGKGFARGTRGLAQQHLELGFPVLRALYVPYSLKTMQKTAAPKFGAAVGKCANLRSVVS